MLVWRNSSLCTVPPGPGMALGAAFHSLSVASEQGLKQNIPSKSFCRDMCCTVEA